MIRIPTIAKVEVFPVAGHDCMELNLSGAHAPYFTRNIVILTDSNGVEGVGEVPGGQKITDGIEVDREQVMKAHKLYMDNCLGARDDAIGMHYLIPGWKFDNKKPCLVR